MTRRLLSALVLGAALAAVPAASPASAAIPPPCEVVRCPAIYCEICEPPIVGCWWIDDLYVCI